MLAEASASLSEPDPTCKRDQPACSIAGEDSVEGTEADVASLTSSPHSELN